MERRTKILVVALVLLTTLSVSATFYQTVILQDFEMKGAYIEFPTPDTAYVWFVYNNEEYELELETSDFDEILVTAAEEIGIQTVQLEPGFIELLKTAHDEGEVTYTGELKPSEPLSAKETKEDTDTSAATSTEKIQDDSLGLPVIE